MSVTAASPPAGPHQSFKGSGWVRLCSKKTHSTHKAEALSRGGLSGSLSPTQGEGLPASSPPPRPAQVSQAQEVSSRTPGGPPFSHGCLRAWAAQGQREPQTWSYNPAVTCEAQPSASRQVPAAQLRQARHCGSTRTLSGQDRPDPFPCSGRVTVTDIHTKCESAVQRAHAGWAGAVRAEAERGRRVLTHVGRSTAAAGRPWASTPKGVGAGAT